MKDNMKTDGNMKTGFPLLPLDFNAEVSAFYISLAIKPIHVLGVFSSDVKEKDNISLLKVIVLLWTSVILLIWT